MSLAKGILFSVAAVVLVSGCASSKMKERKVQQEKVAQTSKMYCEFVNGEVYPDVDVALNLAMAKQCDLEKPFSLTQYKTPSENPGVIYCCNVAPGKLTAVSASAKKSEKPGDKKADDKKTDEVIE